MNQHVLICGGFVVDGESAAPYRADVLISNGRITQVGSLRAAEVPPDALVLEGADRLVVPGFIDAHSHVDGAVFTPEVQLSLLRQGITSVIGGQDGISFAPGDGSYAGEYFAAINGAHPHYRGSRISDLLSSYDGQIPVHVAALVPAGTVRHEVMGSVHRRADTGELQQMISLVQEGIDDGAVGLSTGLDYVPGIFADAEEIAALCAPLRRYGLPYVTHMRGGYEGNAQLGIDEVAQIALTADVPVHVSHFHAPANDVYRLMAELKGAGIAASFDAYPYTRGCSILSMTMLPPELNALGVTEVSARLMDPAVRAHLRRDWFPRVERHPSLGSDWPKLMTISHTDAPEFTWARGLTLEEIAAERDSDAIDTALDILVASRLNVSAIMAVEEQRPIDDIGRIIAHPDHMGGSDGIFIGGHLHPRARGAFASYLATFVREHGFLDWPDAVRHLSTAAADRFNLGDRGRLRPGWVADIALVDPQEVRDRATYSDPNRLAEGIDDVLVSGIPVLRGGKLTGANPGGGLRSSHIG